MASSEGISIKEENIDVKQEFDIKQECQGGFDNPPSTEDTSIKQEFDCPIKLEPFDHDNEFEDSLKSDAGSSNMLVTVTPEKGIQRIAWEVVEEVRLDQAGEMGTSEVSPTRSRSRGMRKNAPGDVEMEPVEEVQIKTEIKEEGCGVVSVCEEEEVPGLKISGVVSGEAQVQAVTGELAWQGSARRVRKRKTDMESGTISGSASQPGKKNRSVAILSNPGQGPSRSLMHCAPENKSDSGSVLSSLQDADQPADDDLPSAARTNTLRFQVGNSQGTSNSASDSRKAERKTFSVTSESLLYPHCGCKVPDGEGQAKEKGLQHVGVIWVMNRRIFTFSTGNKLFMFLMEYHLTNILPRLGLVDTVLLGLMSPQREEVRSCSSQEWKFMSRVYKDWETTLNTSIMVTPVVMHLIYTSAEKLSGQGQWMPFVRTMFYQQQYGHVCPWTTLVTPLAARDNPPDLTSILNKGQQLAKGSHVPTILARLRKQSAQQAERQLSQADSASLVSQALEQLVTRFGLKGVVEPFCTCCLTLDDLTTPYEVGGTCHFQVMRVSFMGSRSVYCWLRPSGLFVSVQELKVLGLLPWKQLMVEDMLLGGRAGCDRDKLLDRESSFLRSVARSVTGEICTMLVSLKYLRLIYRCLANFDALWEPFPAAKFYLKLREHSCHASNINPGVWVGQSGGREAPCVEQPASFPHTEQPAGTQDTTGSRAGCDSSAHEANSDASIPSNSDKKTPPGILLRSRKHRRKGNVQSGTCTAVSSMDTNTAVLVGTSAGSAAVDSMVKRTSEPKKSGPPGGSVTLSGPLGGSVTLPCPPVADDKQQCLPYKLADFPMACNCIPEMAVFPYFSILACAPTSRNCDVMPINKHMGQAIIDKMPSFVVLYTFTADDTLFMSVGELTAKGILRHDLDLDTIPSYGPSNWLRRGEDLELRCLRVRKVNLKATTFGQYVISAELLCHLTSLPEASDFGTVTQADIHLLPLGHVCDNPKSLAFEMQSALKPHQGVDDVDITRAWAWEEASRDARNSSPVIWPDSQQDQGNNKAEARSVVPKSDQDNATEGRGDGGSAVSAPPISSALCEKTEKSASGTISPTYPTDVSVSRENKLQIALRILKAVDILGNPHLKSLKSSHSDYFMAEAGGSLTGLIDKVQQRAKKARVAAGEEPLAMLQSRGLTDPEAIAKLLPMYEGKCVRKHMAVAGSAPVASTAEPQNVCLEALRSSLGDRVNDYWIVLTGVLNYNGDLFTTMFVDNKLYINWSEFTNKNAFSAEVVYQLACTLRIYVYRPPPAVCQHLLKFQRMHHYGSPWVTVSSLRTVYFLGYENSQCQTYPKTFTYLHSRFVQCRPMGTFSDFILIKKKLALLPLT